MTENENIYKIVQTKYNIKEVAENLGIRLHRVGSGFRADSIANDGTGKDAFAIYEQSNSWYDFMLQIGGDITDLVAYVKYDGNKGDALRELMPEFQKSDYKIQVSKFDEFMKQRKKLSDKIFEPNYNSSIHAHKYFANRKITDKTIKELLIGLDFSGNSVRLLFPYWDQSGTRITYYTTRRYDCYGNGENENDPKYKKASLEAHPYLKNSILGLNTIKRAKKEVIITEGMFDWLHCYQQGFSALSPNGTDFGKLWPEVIEIIKQHFKEVILAFDSDEAGQQATYKAAEFFLKEQIPFRVAPLSICKDVAEFCEKGGKIEALINSSREGKKWFIEYIRPKNNFEELTISERERAMEKCKNFVKTISPYTDSADIHEILMAMRNYFSKEWVSDLFTMARKGLKETDVRDAVIAQHNLIYNEKTGFYEYTKKGIWEAKDDTTIQGYISKAYGRNSTGGKITSTLKILKADERVNSSIPITHFNRQICVAFLNGTLHIDLKTATTSFLPHNEQDYVTVRLPYFYKPEANFHEWQNFMGDVTDWKEDKQKLLQEFAGYILIPSCKFEKALLLKGGGSNGKSIFTKIISAVLGGIGGDGRGYVSAAEPSKFGKDFRLMAFKDSWLNISSDVEEDLRGCEGVIKKITSGEIIEDSYKHKDPIPFQTRTKLMMCCNNFPVVKDTSDGFMRRWLIVNFPMHYVQESDVRPNTNDRILDPDLEEKLLHELPGIFNWMLEGLLRLIKQRKFTETVEQKQLLRDFIKANNPLVTFVEESEEVFYEDEGDKLKGKTINRREIFQTYKVWAESSAHYPICANRFYSALSTVLTWMGVEFEINGVFWKFKDVPVDWRTWDNNDDDNEEQTNPKGYIQDPDEEVND